ncbi:MAG: hypothetical protein GKR88_17420 [Flavobacteriaceae bacterium]|nr:MAG: hypothetical protein GKR88_17420 [Flavobacteriaceae bacterium]
MKKTLFANKSVQKPQRMDILLAQKENLSGILILMDSFTNIPFYVFKRSGLISKLSDAIDFPTF